MSTCEFEMDSINSKTPLPRWLEAAAIYHIFPPSFQDSNRDGIGDLNGIRHRLPYLRDLGVNAIWLGPIYDSSFLDGGYDVTDMTRVAPRYGTDEDFDRLVSEASATGIRILLDFVPGHTSLEHENFKESSRHAPGEHRDTYIWTADTFAPEPAGHRFIRGYSERDGAFHTNFFWCQPSLNYGWAPTDPDFPWQTSPDHPACARNRLRIREIMDHWLRRGVSGFRVDMAGSLVKGSGPERSEALRSLWIEVRQWLDRNYPEAVIVSEWSNPAESIKAGFHLDLMLPQHCPGFMKLTRDYYLLETGEERSRSYLHANAEGRLNDWLEPYLEWRTHLQGEGFLSVPTGTHDIPRRIADDRSPAGAKVAMLFHLMLPGPPVLYYGDEIGLRYERGLPSREGAYHRTGQRTPMHWSEEANKGFSEAPAENLYLPLGTSEEPASAAAQIEDPGSLWSFTRALLQLRSTSAALRAHGSFEPVGSGANGYPFAFIRRHDEEEWLVALNPGGSPATANLSSRTDISANWSMQVGACTLENGLLSLGAESGGLGRIVRHPG